MDEGPSSRIRTWHRQLRYLLLLALPGDPRRKVRKLLNIGDSHRQAGHFEQAANAYHLAASLAERIGSHHLLKVARGRIMIPSQPPTGSRKESFQ